MLKQAKNIFFVGIKGVAMANLAVILKKMGKRVDGADIDEKFITDRLLKINKIAWKTGFTVKNLSKDTDLVVYSAAHGGLNNPLTIEAAKRKIKIISQADLLGELMVDFETKIAVAGCHGKTTTSSLLSYALNRLKANPSYIVGVPFFTDYQGADYKEKKYFVVEADEYGVNPPSDKTPKFFKLDPDWIIATNIDFDHPDVYKNIKETKAAFLKFFGSKKLILCLDNKEIIQSLKRFNKDQYVTYGFSDKADHQITDWNTNEEGSVFSIKGIGEFIISLFGKHNISNATAVIVQLLKLGFEVEKIKEAVVGFGGAERRSELVYKKEGNYLMDDYAHHPVEIEATINSARERFKGKRLIVVFQPHTFSRTNFLLSEFRESLSLADIGFVLPIFASARENEKQFNVSSKDIVKGKINLFYEASKIQLIKKLEKLINKGDVIFTMGAGDVYKLKNNLIKIINNKLQMTNKYQISNIKLQKNKDISHFLTLRNHVKAEYFFEAKTREDLIEAKQYSLKNNLTLFMLGGGSNLAVLKPEISGLVVKNSYRELEILEEEKEKITISVSSGYPVSLLIAKSVSSGWKGFEYHQGLPGTVGGAVYMNSKWTKPLIYFGDDLLYAFLVDKRGKVKKVERSYFNFAYDNSILQKTHEIVLNAVFELKKAEPKILKEKAAWALDYRKKTQPFGIASSGCFFRNISNKEKEKMNLPTTSAGYLIDRAGLKNYSVGDFFVSPIHANFIINKGKGKREDLVKLLNIIKSKVREKFGIELKEEVIVV
ncbi:UDP-N-acetylmuramate--L-alanine ligase [Candidatus Roizmanbacteria bacterium]|nr:UDP-N-acetylmuramate--L-alanine ligase [Candidatus Roizmanbacteria bacterium]